MKLIRDVKELINTKEETKNSRMNEERKRSDGKEELWR